MLAFALFATVLCATFDFSTAVTCHCFEDNCNLSKFNCSGGHCIIQIKNSIQTTVQKCVDEYIHEDRCYDNGSNIHMDTYDEICRCKSDYCNTPEFAAKYFGRGTIEREQREEPRNVFEVHQLVGLNRTLATLERELVGALVLLSLLFVAFVILIFVNLCNFKNVKKRFTELTLLIRAIPSKCDLNASKDNSQKNASSVLYGNTLYPNPPTYAHQA